MDEVKGDPMTKDGKRLPLDGGISVFFSFLFYTLVILPIWLFILLPLTIVYQIFNFILSKCLSGKRSKDSRPTSSNQAIVETKENGFSGSREYG